LPKSKTELELEKQLAAETVARWIPSGVQIGIGSGTTSAYFIRALGRRIREERLNLTGIATSKASEELARDEGIPLIEPQRGLLLDLTVDGADEITPELHLIKGGGGKLFREKVIAGASKFLLVIADSSKPVDVLGRMPLPVEVVPFALPWVMDRITSLGADPVLRKASGVPVLTDQGNWLLDCHFQAIADPATLATKLRAIPGVLEHGLFLSSAKLAVVADGTRVSLLRPNRPPAPATDFPCIPLLD
jgi:ribose 5-phosphate isomerase A